ncbi:TIM8 [Candida oxycetoniae]|uniref:Mitochondrial import inner membrane translocase subunit n=1 Tax=Candida oxycetoniae TaxID=497107 RepID=A0AAI9WW74_9ASCO|nr:TIM8 [Candida oxycetoniae]KAI3402871.1 TIM8 [Candida oxycetoniae]
MMSSSLNSAALSSIDDKTRNELMSFVQAEQAKSKVQTAIHGYTDLCFKKCNKDKPITSAKLDLQEEQCLMNCLNRFLDTHIKVVEALQNK